jgi:KaiC/GvpD/RAD55 family RecA-like ATPase
LRRKPSVEKRLSVTDEFLQSIQADRGHTVSDKFTDYFVFPRLERDSTGEQNTKEILTTVDFLDELEAERRIIITGANGSGKSTLLKHLFIELANKKCVILCDIDSIKKKDSKKIVKHVFEDIYGTDPSDYVRFLQLPAEDKVLIIDDIDQIRPQTLDAYISSVSDEFGYMLFATQKVLSLDMIERMRSSLNTNKNICKYKVSPAVSLQQNAFNPSGTVASKGNTQVE